MLYQRGGFAQHRGDSAQASWGKAGTPAKTSSSEGSSDPREPARADGTPRTQVAGVLFLTNPSELVLFSWRSQGEA